jgi:two-component system, OmpR family, response regulator
MVLGADEQPVIGGVVRAFALGCAGYAERFTMKPTPNILVVADAPDSRSLCDGLVTFGLAAQAACDAQSVNEHLAAQRTNLIVLDLMLRRIDALALTRELRATFNVPVILISDHGSAAERIVGLEMGADDCMDRPLVVRELVARIRTVLRRAGVVPPEHSNRIRFDGWELQRSERRLRSPAGVPVALSNAEFQLLSTFLHAPRRVVSRGDLATHAQGQALAATSRSIDLLVSRLRHKLGADMDGAPLIRSVRGVGYLFDARSVEALA